MLYRALSLGLVLVAGAAFAADPPPGGAKGKTHAGFVVKVNAAKGLLIMRGLKDKEEHEHHVAKGADITCDGKTCTLAELKPGTFITVTMAEDKKNTVSKIVGRTKRPVDKVPPAKPAD
jgi:hypothetical protein